jgi:hypothetical protein
MGVWISSQKHAFFERTNGKSRDSLTPEKFLVILRIPQGVEI